MRHTRAHTANRRSHHALKAPGLSTCAKCGISKAPHVVCTNCGTYKGREVVNTLAKATKRAEKKAERSK